MEFWKNRSVLITGNTGFKGTWLTFVLAQLGAKVHGYSLDIDTQPNLFDLTHAREYLSTHVQGDVRDLEKLTQVIKTSQADIVFHLAAQPLVRQSYVDPVETFSSNVMGTVITLEAIRKTGIPEAAVLITTDKVYRNKEWLWAYRENEELGGRDPYSASKSCAEIAIESYRKSFFDSEKKATCKLASARAGNIIGGGDWATDRLIPDIIRAISSSKSLKIRNPNSVRPWQHVLEPVFGYILLAQRMIEDKNLSSWAWNFGPRDEDCVPVDTICKTGLRHFNGRLHIEYESNLNPIHESGILKLDSSMAKTELGWKTKLSIEQALTYTFAWYEQYLAGKSPTELVLSDIKAFIENRNL